MAAVVGGVVRQAAEDARAAGVVLLDDGSAEARLSVEWCVAALGPDRVWPVEPPPAPLADALRAAAPELFQRTSEGRCTGELHRLVGRLAALERNALLAHPANKTALLLGSVLPPEPLLPLGDLYASEVERLAGGWTAPPDVVILAERGGGIGVLDRVLAGIVDQRRQSEAALAALPAVARAAVLEALESGRFARRRIGLIPKLTSRTLGVDCFA